MTPEQEKMRSRIAKSLEPQILSAIGYNALQLENICESPIEVALGSAIIVADQLEAPPMRLGLILCGAREIHSYREGLSLLIPQFPWDGYRIDFALRLPHYRFQYLFIECDGHDFHERTKEQAARDRGKDRHFQNSGIPILRFTGSEIYKDAGSCAAEILAFIQERYDDYIPEA
jgi:very-short-patch-repair endonuclease